MNFRPYTHLDTGLLSVVLSLSWILPAILVRLSPALFFPLGFRFLGGAFFIVMVPLLTAARIPNFSLKLLHASITVASLAYVMAPMLAYYALKTLPSAFVATAYCTLPMWFLVAAYGEFAERRNHVIVMCLALLVFFAGVYPSASLRGPYGLGLLALAGSLVSFLAGIWVSRRLFWLHAAVDLNFWSMLIAAVTHCVLGLVTGEWGAPAEWSRVYWIILGIMTFVVTGAGSYFYRLEVVETPTVVQLTVSVPLLAFGMAIALWGETPINVWTGVGFTTILAILTYNSISGRPNQWMCLGLNNDKRQGDRLICLIDAFMRPMHVSAPAAVKPSRIQVVNLSIGGFGFRSEGEFRVGQEVIVTLPLARNWTSITVDCRVVHVKQAKFRDFPYVGGVQFKALSENRQQSLVEFLARLSNAEEETHPFENIAAKR